MAKNVLPVDFQDDILAESMNGRRKYQMITNSDGTVSFVDVTEYTQVGSNFGQAQVNATNEAVNESAYKNKIIDDKDDLVANSQAGMMAGALAVKAIREELNQNMFTKVTPAANDANGCLTSGMYYVGENWSNLPVNYGILIVFSVENYCVQLFRCVVDSSRSIYSRTSSTNGSTWSEWVDHQGIQ